MQVTTKARRDHSIMVRLTDHESAELMRAADDAERKAADLARVLILAGLGIEEPTQRIGRTEQITIRLPVERVDQLRELARTQHRSLAQQVEHMLATADAIEAQQQAAKQPATHATRNQQDQIGQSATPTLAAYQQLPALATNAAAKPETQVTPRPKTTHTKRRT